MERILEAGMDGYVSKPIDKGKLFRTMDDAMTISQGRKDPETASQGELTQA
jgi:AmiR/NasT family two-component response regulator